MFIASAAATMASAQLDKTEQPQYITDFNRCQPQNVLSEKARRHHWRLLPFEAESLKGLMLVAGQNTAAPEIRYPLRRKGWYAISFGLRSYGGGEDQTHLEVRLADESAFSLLMHKGTAPNHIDDYFWRIAELRDQDIVLRQHCRQLVPDNPQSVANACNGVWLAYIKLVPLTRDQVQSLNEEKRTGQHRRLYAHHDAWSYTYEFRPTSVEEIRRELEPLRDTDFSRIYWEAGMGDRMYYPTKLGLTPADDWIEDPYRIGDRLAAESWREFRKKGIDPFRVALDHSHSMGLEFHATYRPAGFHFPVPEDEWNTGGLYEQHPEWRGRDKAGRPVPRISYAYPEARKVVLNLLREVAAYPVDGICLAYNRRPPLLEYEAPVVEGFRAKSGLDARSLDERDPRWLRYRATALTEFMREVRGVLKEASQRRGLAQPLALTAIVLSSEAENLYQGMDLQAWIREGLVDTLVPYSSVERIPSSADSWVDPQSAEFFYRITRGSNCKLALNLMPRQLSPEEYRNRAHALYKAGSDRLFFWDTNARWDFGPSWSALRRLGHREELASWARSGSPPMERPGSALKKLGDWDLTYATPG